jgi:hypothetical protein
MIALLLALACARPVSLEGEVVDPWGNPVPGAIIVAEGRSEQWATNPQGRFALTLDEAPTRLLGTAPGYMRAQVDVPKRTGHAERDAARDNEALRLVVWPEPRGPGFFAVGTPGAGLLHLPARSVMLRSPSESRALPTVVLAAEDVATGGAPRASSLASGTIPEGTTRFVHKSTLDPRAFRTVDLRLSALERADGDDPGTDGAGWTGGRHIETRVSALPGKDCYLVEVPPLADGVYGFHLSGVLDAREPSAFDTLPRERLLAWVFRVAGTAEVASPGETR